MRMLTTLAVLVGPIAIVFFVLLRATALFASVRRLFDGGEEAVRPVMDRLAVSRGSRSVTLILDLNDLAEGESSVDFVHRFLAQRHRNLELLVLSRAHGVRTELGLAFDLVEVGAAHNATMYRSRRDDRVRCVVPVADDGDTEAGWQAAVAAASGELVFIADGRWDLRPSAVSELAAPWVRTPRIAATFGVLHPRTTGRVATDLVSTRADLVAIAGLGSSTSIHAALGALGSGNEGCIAAMFARETLQRLGGLPGPVSDPATWTQLGQQLQIDAEARNIRNDVHILSTPLGLVKSAEHGAIAADVTKADMPALTRATQLVLAASERTGYLMLFSAAAALAGQLAGTVSAEILWIGATAPLLSVTIVILGLMMDDRALRPAGSTSARLSLLAGGCAAGLWGALGSPLRRPSGELHRA